MLILHFPTSISQSWHVGCVVHGLCWDLVAGFIVWCGELYLYMLGGARE